MDEVKLEFSVLPAEAVLVHEPEVVNAVHYWQGSSNAVITFSPFWERETDGIVGK